MSWTYSNRQRRQLLTAAASPVSWCAAVKHILFQIFNPRSLDGFKRSVLRDERPE
jgi:hypothetical protein